MDYFFEVVQEVTIKVFDRDSNHPLTDVHRHQLCGEVTFTLSSLMCSSGQHLAVNLHGGRSHGAVHVQAEAVTNTRDVFLGQFSCVKLENKDGFFGKSDPFFRIHFLFKNGSFGLAYQSPTITNNLNPVWPRARISMVTLCNGDMDRPIKIEVWDEDSRGE